MASATRSVSGATSEGQTRIAQNMARSGASNRQIRAAQARARQNPNARVVNVNRRNG